MQTLNTSVYPHPSQIVQDAYDALIANLFIAHKEKAMPKTLCVTSAAPREGKTTTAINTAISFMLAGWKVCLVDADIRKTSTAKRLGSESLRGLSDYLDGAAEYGDVVTRTNYEKFHVITCGDATNKNPLGLLYSPRFTNLLERLKADYDFVLFDTSPLESNADASVIASKSDGTLLVTAMKSSRADMQKTIARLAGMGVNIVGNVINKIPRSEYRESVGFYKYSLGAGGGIKEWFRRLGKPAHKA